MDLHLFLVIVLIASAVVILLSLYRGWPGPYLAAMATMAVCALALSCASIRPPIQAARDDFVLACRELTAAMVGDGSPSKAERIASKVCLVEQMGEQIEHAIVKDTGEPDLFTPDVPAPLADPPAASK